MSDIIKTLPIDNTTPTPEENNMVQTLFHVPQNTMATAGSYLNNEEVRSCVGSIANELKEVFIAGILFVILSTGFLDDLIKKFVPVSNICCVLIIIKVLIFMVLFYIFKNISIIRKK